MSQEVIAQVEIADAEFDVRFISQKRRDEIAESCTRRTATSIVGELNVSKFQDAMADELIAGWRAVTPVTAMLLGYPDYEQLPINETGEVPYTIPTARKLYRFCLRDAFANEIDQASRAILKGLAIQKKAADAPSATSSAATS